MKVFGIFSGTLRRRYTLPQNSASILLTKCRDAKPSSISPRRSRNDFMLRHNTSAIAVLVRGQGNDDKAAYAGNVLLASVIAAGIMVLSDKYTPSTSEASCNKEQPEHGEKAHDSSLAEKVFGSDSAFGERINWSQELYSYENRVVRLFKKCTPSVVHITTTTMARVLNFNLFEMPTGTGSGFVWDDGGHIVTNYHVIKGARRAFVTLSDQTTVEAEIVGVEPEKDIAVLRIDPKELNGKKPLALEVGSSKDIQVGQSCYAIGNPFGLDHTLTSGIVSGVGREVPGPESRLLRGMIQTDAAINPGNSGGPLLDSRGRLIGINTLIYSPSGVSTGLGFAIPVNTVKRIVTALIKDGKVLTPVIGVDLAPDLHTALLGIDGVLVLRVHPNTSAESAGLIPTKRSWTRIIFGDIIQKVEDEQVATIEDFLSAVENYNVGDVVTLTVLRDDKEIRIKVRLDERKSML